MSKIIIFLAIFGAVMVFYTFIEAKLLRVNRQTVKSYKLPKSFDGFTIAFISDIHNCSRKGSFVKRVVKKINELNPDIVLIGGDFNSKTTPDDEVCYEVLSHINADCYTVLGNHDYYPDDEKPRRFIKKYGIGNINNKSFWIKRGNEKIKIGGMDDYWMGYPYPESFLHDVTCDDFTVLVCHNPDFFEVFDMERVSLAFAGHHHGGQCSFFGLWAPMIRSELGVKYSGRCVHKDGAVIICSNGIGTSHLPVRFCAVPEINFITLHSEDK